MKPIRVAIVADYPEEGWPSMDLAAEMVLMHLRSGHVGEVEAVRVCPPYSHRFGRLPLGRFAGAGRNADRMLNRYLDYPRYLKALTKHDPFDVYHVIDHSYAQVVPALPSGRTVVTCHDLDAFRCLLRPDLEPRPAWFRAMARRTLDGLRAASAVACVSRATFDAVREHDLIPEERLHVIPNGIHPEFLEAPDPAAEAEVDRLLGPADPSGPPILLHVGSTIPRKRIDVLLDVFAGIHRAIPGATLVKAGGAFNPAQAAQARALGIDDAIRIMPFFDDRRVLAALYRRASLVLQPSAAEGFGLPLAEALATGAPLLVSDLPVFREVAGEAAVYRPVGEIPAWIEAALALLNDRLQGSDAHRARRDAGLARSARYRWDAHADGLAGLYRDLVRPSESAPPGSPIT
jgi:glycosyltransferase involved in cell wall biosynthesis